MVVATLLDISKVLLDHEAATDAFSGHMRKERSHPPVRGHQSWNVHIDALVVPEEGVVTVKFRVRPLKIGMGPMCLVIRRSGHANRHHDLYWQCPEMS